jgi:hypothetical protein
MAELGEPVGTALGHTKPHPKCPFCPPKARKEYTTYPGAANHSGHLGDIMLDVDQLVPLQTGARPQQRAKEEGWAIEQSKATARKYNTKKTYTFQAHHLISGNQAMKGQKIEKWITASSKNKKDTGYSINNTNNGFWAPSMPKKYVDKWSAKANPALTDKKRQQVAEAVMRAEGAQIHIGPHNITDDKRFDRHHTYDKYIKFKLKELNKRIILWSDECLCEQKKPKKMPMQATHRVHDALDAVSDHMQGKITGGVRNWDVFLSKYARDYHNKPGNCPHGKKMAI